MYKVWRIYMYTFPNGKRYIGATSQTLAGRQGKNWQRYKGCKIYDAIEEFGKESIKQEILIEKEMDDKEASKLEKEYIALYKTNEPEFGYNLYNGGEGLHKENISEERLNVLKKQMSEIGKRKRNVKVSLETRAKQRAAKLGTKLGPMREETKAKISKANSRDNMTEQNHLNRSRSKQKKVIAIEKTTGEIIVFESGNEAAKHFNVRPSAVSRWISGDRKPRVNYSFSFYSPTTTE